MLITLKSFEKIGNLTNKLNVIQSSSYSNRHYLEVVSKQKLQYISDYTEENALEAIKLLDERIEMFSVKTKKDYKLYENNSQTQTKRVLNKKGVSNKKPIEII